MAIIQFEHFKNEIFEECVDEIFFSIFLLAKKLLYIEHANAHLITHDKGKNIQ